ncbi:HAD-IB family phosphatase [Acanthopleuribacter pedis]|uniref:phosphoserine phosphatase n=1 Tax=Acanthopleuribacter pedis TaxID=442870 RepID=A0A8J7QD86_9BACT|nr:HAD-IB family phosphatase [Acanthopleuribacter pedis]MBO1322392.1 HAD-IB family phosphatase [Acanthopleuribacter pedis]
MTIVIFDFDSTLLTCESLEEILKPVLADAPDKMAQIEAITKEGMEGKLDFKQSLARRLEVAQPTLRLLQDFGAEGDQWLTEGIADLVRALLQRGIEVRIVSGGLWEAIVPVAGRLGIPAERVHAVRLKWADDGSFVGIDDQDPFSENKIVGCKPLFEGRDATKIAVGDGMTDHALFASGIVNHFVAYTEHARREAVVATGAPEARNSKELANILEAWL